MLQRFKFKAYDLEGKLVDGELDAEDTFAAMTILRSGRLSVAEISTVKNKRHLFARRKNFDKQVTFFFRQLAVLIDGSTIEESLASMKMQQEDRFLHEVSEFLHEQISAGKKFHYALERFNAEKYEIFSDYVVGMVRIGEESGRLTEIFELLANFLEKEFIRREKFRSSLIYPKILFSISIIALIFLLTFVLPTFAMMFESFNGELPLPTKILLSVGNFANTYGIFLIVLIFLAIIAFEYFYQDEAIRLRVDEIRLQIPIIGRLEKLTACMYIFRALSVMLKSGMPIDEATLILKTVPPNRFFRRVLENFHENILHGMAIPRFFEQQSIFPRTLTSLIFAGYHSGKLEEMFEKCADYCELNADELSTRMQAMIEPTLIICLALIIFLFVISVVLPMLDLMTQIGG